MPLRTRDPSHPYCLTQFPLRVTECRRHEAAVLVQVLFQELTKRELGQFITGTVLYTPPLSLLSVVPHLFTLPASYIISSLPVECWLIKALLPTVWRLARSPLLLLSQLACTLAFL